MAKRPKYHFMKVIRHATGLSAVTLPGQTFGQIPVRGDVLVTDARSSHVLRRLKRRCAEGDVLFTTTLKAAPGKYTVRDAFPLKHNTEVLYSDAQALYDALAESLPTIDRP